MNHRWHTRCVYAWWGPSDIALKAWLELIPPPDARCAVCDGTGVVAHAEGDTGEEVSLEDCPCIEPVFRVRVPKCFAIRDPVIHEMPF